MEGEKVFGLEPLVFAMGFELVHDRLIDRYRRCYLVALEGVDDHVADRIYTVVHLYRSLAVSHDELHQVVVVLLQRCLRCYHGFLLVNLCRVDDCRRVHGFLLSFVLDLFVAFLHLLAADRDDLVGQYLLAHVQPLRAVFDIDLPRDDIRDDGDGGRDIFDQRCAFERVVARILAQQRRFETDEIRLVVLYIADELRRVMALRIAVRVLSVRQQHHLDVEPRLEEHVDTPERRMDTCRIAVVEHGDVTREAFDEPYLRFGQRRTAAGDNVLDTRLVHRDDIHLSLHEITHVGSGDRLFGLEEAV